MVRGSAHTAATVTIPVEDRARVERWATVLTALRMTYPIEQRGIHCQNPACFANPHYPVEEARTRLAEQARRAGEERARQRNHESAMERIREGQAARANVIADVRAEADRRGCCVRCALKDAPYRVKYVKHRVKCPLEK